MPHVNGEVTTDKPPLFFWLIALFSLPFGEVLSLTARLPSALAALGTLLLTVRLGRRMGDPRVAVLAAALLATTHMFWDKARWAQIDPLLCFLILTAVSAFEAFRAGDAAGRRAGVLFWSACARAVLSKGPVGLLLPLGVALLTLAWDRELGRWRSFATFAGPLGIRRHRRPVGGRHPAVGRRVYPACGYTFAAGFPICQRPRPTDSVFGALREHFVDRAIHGMHHEQPVWYYGKVLPLNLLPWSFLIPGALLLAWHRRQADDRLLLVFVVFVVGFFTVSTEKRDLYILPALPAFALLWARLISVVTGWWREAVETGAAIPGRRWVTVPLGMVGALMVLASLAAPFAAQRLDEALLGPAAALAAVLGAGGLGMLVTAARGLTAASVQWTAGTTALAMLAAVSFVYPVLDPGKSGRELGEVMRNATVDWRAAGHTVLAFPPRDPPGEIKLGNVMRAVNFYSGGVYMKEIADLEQLRAELAAAETTYLLANAAALPEEERERMNVLYSTRLSRRDLLFLRYDRSSSRGD